MQYLENIFGQPWFNIILSVAILAFAYVAAFVIKHIVHRYISKLAAKTTWKWDGPVIQHLGKHIYLWCALLGLYFTKEVWHEYITIATFNIVFDKVLIIIFGISVIMALLNISASLIGIYGETIHQAMPMTNITKNLAKVAIIILGGLMLMSALGISITPLLTTLGIGGLAIALALQDTLSNMFAGFYITIAKNIRPGDFIKLESGEEGYVEDISWRVTTVRLLPDNIVIIPNSKLSQSITTNYYMPKRELAVYVEVGVHYNSDLKYVEEVTLEVAREIQKDIEGSIKEFSPLMRYHTFDSSSINFKVIMRAKEVLAGYKMKHEFIKKLHERYKEKGIVIPYPIRAINLDQENAKLEIIKKD